MRYIIQQTPHGDFLQNGQRVSVIEIADCAKVQASKSVTIYEAEDLTAFKKAQNITNYIAPKPTPKPVMPDTVMVGTFHFKCDEASQNQFANLATLLQLARDAQPDAAHRAGFLAANISAVAGPITDAAGAAHDMTVAQTFLLILAYGQAVGAARAAVLAG